MLIQVLGTGCAKCRTLYETVQKAVAETGVDALVEKIEDIEKIMAFEILMTPGLVIDGQVKTAGRLPSLEEIKKLILAANIA
ncbi:MAG: thioredoxin family protein [Planctomycetaceae bacterium]|nr:thioredoxin family protein [Planctomycetaceae bacterium]